MERNLYLSKYFMFMSKGKGLYAILLLLVAVLAKCLLPDDKPEIIPLPQQSVSDKGDFVFDRTTTICVENEQQLPVAEELAGLFTRSAGFTPEIRIREKGNRCSVISFRTDSRLQGEHYKLDIGPSYIGITASGNAGFFYAVQSLRLLLPSDIESPVLVKRQRWAVPGLTIQDGPRCTSRTILLQTPYTDIPVENVRRLIDYMAILKINGLHFQQGAYSPADEESREWKTLEEYAGRRKVTVTKGMQIPEGMVSDLPLYMEQLIRRTDNWRNDETVIQLFRYLTSASEKGWRYSDDRKGLDRRRALSIRHLEGAGRQEASLERFVTGSLTAFGR